MVFTKHPTKKNTYLVQLPKGEFAVTKSGFGWHACVASNLVSTAGHVGGVNVFVSRAEAESHLARFAI